MGYRNCVVDYIVGFIMLHAILDEWALNRPPKSKPFCEYNLQLCWK